MTNEQLLALVIAAFIGLIPNVVLKYLDKHKSKEEVADIEVDTLSQTLKEMREHNDFLEKRLSAKREEITLQNKLMYDINTQNVLLVKQNTELTAQVLDITTKLQECIKCIDKFKLEEESK